MAKTAQTTAPKASSNGSKTPSKTWKSLRKTYEQIEGFWTREGVLTGNVLSRVSRDTGDFFVMRLTEEGGNVRSREDGESHGTPGMVIGVPHSAVLNVLDEVCGKSTEVRLTPHGKKQNKKGAEFWDIEVEISEDSSIDSVIS